MKVFKDLTIVLRSTRSEEFIAALERNLPSGWTRDKEAESHAVGPGPRGHVYIVCDQKGERESALVAIVPREGGYYVSNIVPRQTGRLTHDQYNRILDEFADECIGPLEKTLDLQVIRSSDSETLENWVSKDTAEKFRHFSGLANKSTGTSHPMDKERWYDFIIAVVTNQDSLDASTLDRWLFEEDGWDEDMANEMAIEYEQEVGLLKHYLESSGGR